MLSPGKKIEYSCPWCDSENIRHRRQIGEIFGALLDPSISNFNSGWCYDCGDVFPWSARIKRSLKNVVNGEQ